jgi:hypothetical protein
MKIRIKGNSLRYRLTKTDVAKLTEDGYIQERTAFVNQAFTYALKLTDEEQLSAVYKDNAIMLYVPKALVEDLADENKVGFEGIDGSLHLLVEKDFTCLDEVAEDQSDNYPNPLATKKL